MTYPGTEAHFEQYRTLPDLHDPIVLGPGSDSIQATSQVYSSLAETFDRVVGDLKAVLARSRHSQRGKAADAARQHVLKIVSVGEVGAEHARLATYALQEQAAYFARARTDMQAAADRAASGPSVPAHGTKGPSQVAVDAAHEAGLAVAIGGANLYETNSNHNLTFVFQGFDPPQIAAAQVAAGPQQTPNWGGGGDHGPTPVGSASVVRPATPPVLALPSATLPPASRAPSPPVIPGLVPSPPDPGASGGASSTVPGVRTSSPSPPTAVPTTPASRSVPTLPGGRPSPGPLPGSSLPDGARPTFPIGNDLQAGRSGWMPGQPWTTRPGANQPGATSGEYRSGRSPGGLGSEPARSGTGETRSVSGRPSPPGVVESGPARPPATGHQPYMPMGGAGGSGRDSEHRRPSWLLEPDPEALWMSGLPPHGPAVIEPLED